MHSKYQKHKGSVKKKWAFDQEWWGAEGLLPPKTNLLFFSTNNEYSI